MIRGLGLGTKGRELEAAGVVVKNDAVCEIE